jgi:hypothetical protein
MDPVPAALALATLLAEGSPYSAPPSGRTRWRRTIAIGDPQAPFESFLRILAVHGLLADHGTLLDDVRIVSIGDHFDWGSVCDRARATYDGLRLLAWLASHPCDQAILLAGNHDLARVGELAHCDDLQYQRAREEADRAYRDQQPIRPEAQFCAAFDLPSWEVASRDLSAFCATQRDWIKTLLRAGRLRLSCALGGVLLTHAGISTFELDALALDERARRDPEAISLALQERFERTLRHWRGEPLSVPGLHSPGNAHGEGAGILYHRFTTQPPNRWSTRVDGLRRRTHVSALAPSLTQAIGHTRDHKSLQLLGLDPTFATVGRLRTLSVDDGRWHYAPRVDLASHRASAAILVHLDGAMFECEPEHYQLFDLDHRAVLAHA